MGNDNSDERVLDLGEKTNDCSRAQACTLTKSVVGSLIDSDAIVPCRFQSRKCRSDQIRSAGGG